MAQAKGTLLVHFRDYVREEEPGGWDRVLASLRPSDRAVIDGLLVSSMFYPIGVFNRAVDAFMRTRPNPRLTMHQLADYTAERDLPTLYKVLMKLGSLETILGRADSVWRRYFDVGTVTTRQIAPKHFEMHLTAPQELEAGPGLLICSVAVSAWWQHAFRVARVNAGIVHDTCRY